MARAADLAESVVAIKQHLKASDLDQALQLTQAALANHPGDAQLWELLGVAQYRSGDVAGSRQAFERSVLSDPTSASAYTNLAVAHEGLGDFAQAEFYYRLALAQNSQYDQAAKRLKRLQTRKVDRSPTRASPDSQAEQDFRARATVGDLGQAEILFAGRRILRSYLGQIVLGLALLIVAFFLIRATSGSAADFLEEWLDPVNPDAIRAVSLSLFVLGAALIMGSFVSSALTYCEIDTDAVHFGRGAVYRRNDTIWHFEIEEVELRQTFFQILANTATIRLITERMRKNQAQVVKLKGLGPAHLRRSQESDIRARASLGEMHALRVLLRDLTLQRQLEVRDRFLK